QSFIGPESVGSAGFEEAALLQAAVGADILEEVSDAPSGAHSARTAASWEERLLAEVAGDLLPAPEAPSRAHSARTAASWEERVMLDVAGDLLTSDHAKLMALIEDLQRRPLQQPQAELRILGGHQAEPEPCDASVQIFKSAPPKPLPDSAKPKLLPPEPAKKPEMRVCVPTSPGPPPRIAAVKAESDSSGAEPTMVPGQPALLQAIGSSRLHLPLDPCDLLPEDQASLVATPSQGDPSEVSAANSSPQSLADRIAEKAVRYAEAAAKESRSKRPGGPGCE
ncbi:unnamed protein product, partial [Effrenium voratum]